LWKKIAACRRIIASTVRSEAGSKPELMAVLAMHKNADGIIVCNAIIKTAEFIPSGSDG